MKSISFLITLAMLFLVCTAASAADNDAYRQKVEALRTNPKIVRPEEIIEQFLDDGKDMVRVFVSLPEPDHIRKNHPFDYSDSFGIYQGSFGNAAYRAYVKTEVARVMNPILERYASNPNVQIRHTYAYSTFFSANVTVDGINELTGENDVPEISAVPTDTMYTMQGIPLMGSQRIRNNGNWRGQHVGIAVIDSGVDYTHPELGGGGFPNDKVVGGYDCVHDNNDPMDDHGHGTCVAGIAAGNVPPGGAVGGYVGGVAPEAKIYALKTISSGGHIDIDDVILAIDWCVDNQRLDPNNPIMIINLSQGRLYGQTGYCDQRDPRYKAAIDRAIACGITVIAAAGNSKAINSIARPACYSNVISVGAVYDADVGTKSYMVCTDPTTHADQVTCYSNSDNILDLLAPAENAFTPDIVGTEGYAPYQGYANQDYFDKFGGTSTAAPYTSGSAACLLSYSNARLGVYLKPARVREILTQTGTPILDPKSGITTPRVELDLAWDEIFASNPPTFQRITDRTYQAGTNNVVEGCGIYTNGYERHIKAYCRGNWWVGADTWESSCSTGWEHNDFEYYYGKDYALDHSGYISPGDCPGYQMISSSGTGNNEVTGAVDPQGYVHLCRGDYWVNASSWTSNCATGWELNVMDPYLYASGSAAVPGFSACGLYAALSLCMLLGMASFYKNRKFRK